jgi:malonate transporter and related proteins
MEGVLEGFATIGIVIAVGLVLAHVNVLGEDSQVLLSRLAFFVASPALMVTVLARSDVSEVLSKNLVASAAGVVVTGALYLLLARLYFHKNLGDSVIGVLSSVYVNSANLGIPIAAYVLGNAALVAPILLMQLLVLQPMALAVLDMTVPGQSFSVARSLARPLTNPLTLGSLLGLALSLTHTTLPTTIHQPLVLIGGMAVPGMLLAYGVSLRFGPLPGTGVTAPEVAVITALKMVVYPVSVYVIARYLLSLDGHALFAVTVLAALPTAQNIFVHATRYGRAVVIARDSIFVTTILSVPAMFLITALLT